MVLWGWVCESPELIKHLLKTAHFPWHGFIYIITIICKIGSKKQALEVWSTTPGNHYMWYWVICSSSVGYRWTPGVWGEVHKNVSIASSGSQKTSISTATIFQILSSNFELKDLHKQFNNQVFSPIVCRLFLPIQHVYLNRLLSLSLLKPGYAIMV